MGALQVDKVVKGHQAWRLLSCMWLHAGVFHILANMLSLVFIGIRLEQEFGFRMYPFNSSCFVKCFLLIFFVSFMHYLLRIDI